MASSDSEGTVCLICCGLIILLYIADMVGKNITSIMAAIPAVLYWIVVVILCIGIFYEAFRLLNREGTKDQKGS